MMAELPDKDEAAKLDAVAREVKRVFPELPADQVEITVLEHWREFRSAPVRDFVPLFVRRRAIADLRSRASRSA